MDGLDRLIQSIDKPPAGQYRDIVARVAVEGRAVTNIAQNLKHCCPGFEEWYRKYQDEMKEDHLCKFFYRMRTDKLKQGNDHVSSFSISNLRRGFNLSIIGGMIAYGFHNEKGEYVERSIPPPIESAGCFVDSNGIGWNIQNLDGTSSKQYAEVPMHQIGIDLWFDAPPEVHKGSIIDDKSAENLCKMYVDYLRDFVKQLEIAFCGQSISATPNGQENK